MNKSYKSVWNDATGTWVAAQENAKGQGKKNRSIKAVASAAVGMAMAIGTSAAHAGIIANCNGSSQGSYASFSGTGGAWINTSNPSVCAAGGTGVVLNEDPSASSQQTGKAWLAVGGTNSTNSGTVTLYGPSGIALNGATTTSGLATFKAGADMSNTKITNVAAGAVSSTSTEAVNGSQLWTTNQNVAALNASVGLIKQDATSNAITIATATAGTTVDFTGTAGARQLKGVAAGVANTDAVNIGQLKTAGLTTDASGNVTNAFIAYNDATKGKVTLGGGNAGTTMTNVAAGALSDSSSDAVNGSQLYTTNQNVANNTTSITNLGNTITNIAGDTSTTYTDANGEGIRYARTNEAGLTASDAFAQGQGSTALGYNATTAANAINAVALGNGATANDANAVALGAGSSTAAAVATSGDTIDGVAYT